MVSRRETIPLLSKVFGGPGGGATWQAPMLLHLAMLALATSGSLVKLAKSKNLG
ncbi:hypothetical protein [Candidatus Williamhamiltonella defendens]|uniref:hypothetical protein n=1 Tax=Candidatus Williamhamiltonella defendens TaxID=138072 RepID=UPI001582CE19|nr:hypothetical protein [Candidatus Hamiltonella defensa]